MRPCLLPLSKPELNSANAYIPLLACAMYIVRHHSYHDPYQADMDWRASKDDGSIL